METTFYPGTAMSSLTYKTQLAPVQIAMYDAQSSDSRQDFMFTWNA